MSSIRSFVPLEKLGEGTYSNVYKVRRVDDNDIYALKKVKLQSLTQKEKQNALNEVRILASIQSPYIVAYKEAFFDESLNVLCVVMEYAEDGDLQKSIKSHVKSFKIIQEEQIWKASQSILKGLQNLHFRGILHRDIKCANIFRHKGIYKLGDLNVSKVNGDKLAYTQTGTPYYASPQVWRDEPYDHKSDIWSFGCIIYQMAALRPPFNGKDMEDLFKNVQKGKVMPLSAHYSNDLWKFIELCLQKDPKKRPSANELLKYLKKHSQNSKSGLKIQNPENNKLLKTIKLPNDLKKLNEALPTSKYRKNNFQGKQQQQIPQQNQYTKIEKNQSQQNSNNPNNEKSAKNNQKKIKSDCQSKHISVLRQNVNNAVQQQRQPTKADYKDTDINHQIESERKANEQPQRKPLTAQNSYRSPKGRTQIRQLFKSPASEVRLMKKVQNSLGYSQRIQKNQRKPSTAGKVERLKKELDIEINLNKITQNLKKPISIPRTQKKQNVINNSHLIQGSPFQIGSSNKGAYVNRNSSELVQIKYGSNHRQGPKYIIESNKHEALDNWKHKLMKKNRILSSNHPKPSWW